MLQYIINSSCIWLLGLIVFDIFLRNEANHTYNRLYLLSILLAGVLVPMWVWDYDAFIYANDASRPIVEQATNTKETMITASERTVLGWEQWIAAVYISGVALFSMLFIKDLVTIVLLYKRGTKSKDGTWTIIETGKNQSPFSAFRYVFISSKQSYHNDELQMILAHEEQHGHLLHFIDVLVTRLSTIVFWFNPIVYIIQKRLLLVHEYQADLAVKENKKTYGKFLVEQSVLGSAPILAHSFIYSPLKKRIIMMTKKTTTLAKSKQVLIIPVMLLSMLLFTQNAFSWGAPEREGNKVTYRGNVIEYPYPGSSDTSMIKDAKTGEQKMIVTRREPHPTKLNGEKIYMPGELQPKKNGKNIYARESSLNGQAIKEYLLSNMKKEIKMLEDGSYRLNVYDVVVDRKGKIVYFTYGGLKKTKKIDGPRQSALPADEKVSEAFGKKIAILLNDAPKHTPAVYDGEDVNSAIVDWSIFTNFEVKDKKLSAL